jgi:exopolyphosphatase/guanosine-5'-triphosphate,3'-diphosphate pyrophosphatase
MVALIARFHRGSLPSNREDDFAALSKADQRVVAILSAIIRLVEELDREHLRRITKITVRKRGDNVSLILPSRLPLLVERLGAESRKKALEESLGVKIAVV